MKPEDIKHWFDYHKPSEADVAAMQRWRNALTDVARDFVGYTPSNGDVIVALRALKTAMMAMNSALVAPMPKIPPSAQQR